MSALARELTRPVGSGTPEDADAVIRELALFPDTELQMLVDSRVGVRVCRESVTDYRHDLLGDTPRGWPAGVNWDSVPGCYCPDEHNVVIATIADMQGGRRVPPKGIKHGAWNLVLHETMHADDYIADRRRCLNPEFLAARSADMGGLTAYEAQSGQAGFEESYAESAARYFGGDVSLTEACPHLAEFWRRANLPLAAGPKHCLRQVDHDGRIGSIEVADGGRVVLDLVAEAPGGTVGHALIVLSPGDPGHDAVTRRLGDGRRRRGPLLLKPF